MRNPQELGPPRYGDKYTPPLSKAPYVIANRNCAWNLDSVGIGQYTVVDQGTVTLNDIGSNFFLDQDSLGKSRAQQACELLGELNEDVKGHWVAKDIMSLLEESPNYLSNFTLVITTAVTRQAAEKIAGLCWQAGQDGGKQVSFVWVKTVGLIGAARIAVPEHLGKSCKDSFFCRLLSCPSWKNC